MRHDTSSESVVPLAVWVLAQRFGKFPSHFPNSVHRFDPIWANRLSAIIFYDDAFFFPASKAIAMFRCFTLSAKIYKIARRKVSFRVYVTVSRKYRRCDKVNLSFPVRGKSVGTWAVVKLSILFTCYVTEL